MELVNSLDFFQTQVPVFTINNKKSLGTSIGFLLSVFISILVLAFTTTKGVQVFTKSQAIIT